MGEERHRLQLSFESVGESPLVVRFAINEALSTLFGVSVLAESDNHDFPLAAVIGKGAGLRVTSGNPIMPTRVWAGLVDHCEQVHAEVSEGSVRQSTYYFHIVPQLWKTTQRRNCRIFQRLSLPDIVKALLGEWELPATWKLTKGDAFYKKHDYVVQYAESDFAFICRLLEWAGISFYFAFEGTKEPDLVLTDDPTKGPARPGEPIPAFDEPPLHVPPEFLRRVRLGYTVQPGRVMLRDYEFRRQYDTKLFAASKEKAPDPEPFYEQYRYRPGGFLVDSGKSGSPATPKADDKGIFPRHEQDEGERQAELELQSLRKHRRVVRYETNCPDLAPGLLFAMGRYPRGEMEGSKRFLCAKFSLEGTPEGEWSMAGEAAFTDYPWVPDRTTPQPRVLGMQSAMVVGPKGQEIHTDEHGRVRVQFHWDREGKYDDNSSCWVRASQDWAGVGFGSFLLPRIGHEVLVAYYEGDPDQPVVVGRVYGGFNQVPYELPEHKTRSTWKSDSTPKGDGLNEIMFEDKKGEELFYLQAEQDLDKLCKKYETERTKNDRIQIVGRNRQSVVGELEATMAGERYLVRMMKKPSDKDLKIQEQKEPSIQPEDTAVDMVNERIVFTTGQATVALDKKHIRLEAAGNITLHAKGGDVIIEGTNTLSNTKTPAAAPKPDPFDPLKPGTYESHAADEVVELVPAEKQPLRQRTDDLDELFQEAAVADQNLHAAVTEIAGENKGAPMFPPGLKGRPRAEEKIRTEYGGDASQLLDVSRASIVFESMDDIYAAKEKIAGKYKIVREKDRFKKPLPGGYRDILLNVQMPPDGHVCEVQLHSKQILEVKNGEGHKIYEETRGLEAKAKDENRPLTAAERQRVDELTARSEQIYGDAFKKFTGG
ncbi:MAG: type VI secretion system tip protein VgrG [Deltaproteobacteria bacterium]|nr:type VI secretion system tip protein VgrG [Deltaproteobacteria bacterium]